MYLSCDYRAAVRDVICFETLALVGGKTMEHWFGNGRKLTSFLLTSPALVLNIYSTDYYVVSVNSNYGSAS